jgi:hypothetical protein
VAQVNANLTLARVSLTPRLSGRYPRMAGTLPVIVLRRLLQQSNDRLVRRITSLFLGARLRGDLRFLSLSAVFGGEVLESLARALVGSLARHLLKAQGPIPKFVRPAERHYLKVELIS